ncbi:GntR family transcriptional regulator [Arthrobacter sp. MA-N2]|uniref:GntR family transcriptional regulator n=1 Tax=Arthrobacter sp. MA-N2 TaxID=1101188 RepID=UPI0009DFD576|nr:GntR family transcriptional regulator [Arthrobacter sp. MA-N2]
MTHSERTEPTEPRTPADPAANSLRSFLVAPEHGSMTDAVTDALREAILSGALAPPAWLREDDLAQTLCVSRTPVREALRRLSDEGLTQRVANRGTVVAQMSIDEILAVYAVRESLEGLAARTAAIRRPAGLVDALTAVHREMEGQVNDSRRLAELNLQFHRLIRDASGNPYLERFLTQVEHAVRRFGRTTYDSEGRSVESLKEHYAILEAIAAGDADRAEEQAVAHMRRAREVRVKQMLAR